MLRYITVILMLISSSAMAESVKPMPEYDDEQPLDLGVLEFTSPRLSLELRKETNLRFIRQALVEPYSRKMKDWDKMRCWLATPVGTRFQHLTCARNGDLEALRRHRGHRVVGAYGQNHFYRRIQPDTGPSLRSRMALLGETSYFDNEFIAISTSGVTPPSDIPDEDELLQFATAWVLVDQLGKANKPEAQLVAAISRQDLTLKRYNRLVELTAAHPSIKAKVNELVVNLN